MSTKKTQEAANFEQSNDLTSPREVLLNTKDVMTSQVADLQADKRDLTRRLEQVEKKNAALTTENIRLTKLADQRAREIRELHDRERASSHRVLQQIADLRQSVLAAVGQFDSAQNELLQTLRSQRA